MKTHLPPSGWLAPRTLVVAAGLLLFSLGRGLSQEAAAAPAADADAAWAETQQALTPPTPPAEWSERRPTPDEIETFREQQGQRAAAAAEKAHTFYETYPDHAEAGTAKAKEMEMLQIALQLGNTNVNARLADLETARLADPNLSEDERFALRVNAIQRAARASNEEDRDALMAMLEQGVRELIKEFPNRDEPYKMLLQLAGAGDPEKAVAIAREVMDSQAPQPARDEAEGLLNKFEALGKPLAIQFTALDGRKVDLAGLKGKVVLIDFWATWCGPCVAELPNVKAAYNRLHPEGFEIVGISFDTDKDRLESFVKTEKMPWPQYFDGKGWENDLGTRFGITSIPTMWLVDKKGTLVDMSARDDLQARVEKLLAQ